MKKLIQSSAFLLLLAFSLSGHSEDKMQGMHHGQSSMKGMMGMMGMSEEQKDQHMKQMQVHMLQMHDLSNRILAETDPVKKQQLKDEQIQLMKDHMKKMMEHRAEMMKKHHQMQQDDKKKE
ncbi:MAG: hypothetical protein ACU833_15300 [Gammaproteobacteria bacterium]